ncbi:hypothetical protein ABKP09_24940 [Peribacillus frigoritolerans]|uniref:hypothetical protein n=1 Tax=Peribacillus frigoritolerans TaxID=450367 RepID=UPI0032B44789
MKEKQNNFEFIAVIGIIFLMIFLSISVLLVFFTSTEWKDMYTTLFSIVGSVVGGLLGGYITLIGVKQTIWGQREQESIKLIPQKLIAIHLLIKKLAQFHEKFSSDVLRIEYYKNFSIHKMKSEFHKGYDLLIGFHLNLSDLEYEFIEIVSQVDIEMYKEIKSFFDEFEENIFSTINSKSMVNVMETIFLDLENDEEFFNSVEKMFEDLSILRKWGYERIREMEAQIPLKLEQYQKEIL